MTDDYQKALSLIQKAKEQNAKELSLHKLTLKKIPDEITSLQNITSLNLWKCKIEDYTNIKTLQNLTYLDVRYNSIQDFSFFKGLINLRILDLGCNVIKNYSFLEALEKLQVLDLKYNSIEDYGFLKNLKNLQWLNLNNHKIKDYSFLKDVKQLRHLDLASNTIKDFSFFKNLNELNYLNLEMNEIENIDWLNSLENLVDLDLGRNKITDISALCALPKLEKLNLWDNKIQDFSPLKHIKQLKSLNLWDNKIEDISFLEHLPNLVDIDLRSNKIQDFSPLLLLKNLTKLNLGYTEFNDTPLLKSFPNLIQLVLVGNKIKDISFLRYLPKLNSLLLSHNKIEIVQNDIFEYLPNLNYLELSNNPIKNIPKKIYETQLDNCSVNVRNYFKDLKKGIHINDALKVVFVGNGRAGKTSLMRVLQGEKFNETEKTTHAIYLKLWQATDEILFNIWDFGGQHLYHTTHLLFLKTEAMSVLVWDIENGNNKEAYEINPETNEKHFFKNYDQVYWLKQLNKNSPKFLVQSKIDKKGNDKETPPQYQEWKKAFNILDSFHIDSKTRRGISHFKEELIDYAKKAIKEQPLIPQSWYDVRSVIQKFQQENSSKKEKRDNSGLKQLPLKDFFALCNYCGLDTSSTWTVLDYLYQTGVFFYDAKLFNGQIILDQEWLIDAIYTLFDRDSIFYKIVSKGDGRFTVKELDEKWINYTLEEKQHFIQYMQQCGICFELNHGQGDFYKKEWVAPYLMSEIIPPSVLRIFQEKKDSIFLQFKYEWLYYGIIQRFIINVRYHSNINQIWRNGIWLQSIDSDALIMANEKTDSICIEVKGQNRKILLDMIRNEFKNNNFPSSEISVSTEGSIFLPLKELEKYQSEIDFTYDGKRYFVNDYKDFLNLDTQSSFSKLHNLNIESLTQKQEKTMIQKAFNNLVRQHIGDGKNDKAFTSLLEWAQENGNSKIKNAILTLRNQWKEYESESRIGTLSYDEAQRTQTKIVKAILEIADILEGTTDLKSDPEPDPIEKPNTASKKLKILMLTALPAKTVEINIDKEFARISKELQGNNAFDLMIENHVNQSEFKKFTETNQPDVLHFSGHGLNGGKQGGIVLQNDHKNGYELLSPDKLSFLFKYFKRSFSIQTVILNACLSEEQAVAISQHVPYVVGTTDEIEDEHSIAFSVGFYFKLVQSKRNFELAFDSGRTEAVLKGAKETDFVFYKNGKIWDIDTP